MKQPTRLLERQLHQEHDHEHLSLNPHHHPDQHLYRLSLSLSHTHTHSQRGEKKEITFGTIRNRTTSPIIDDTMMIRGFPLRFSHHFNIRPKLIED